MLGKIERPADWRLSQKEIAEIIKTPVNMLADPALHGIETMNSPDCDTSREVPFIRIGKHKLWGASYRFLEPILEDIVDDNFSI